MVGVQASEKQDCGMESKEVMGFTVGWSETTDKKKTVKAGKGKSNKKG